MSGRRGSAAELRAKDLYMWDKCNGVIDAQMTDTTLVGMRIAAFVDGARWYARRAARNRRVREGKKRGA